MGRQHISTLIPEDDADSRPRTLDDCEDGNRRESSRPQTVLSDMTAASTAGVSFGSMPLKKLAMREVRLTYRAFEGLVFPRLLAAAPEGRSYEPFRPTWIGLRRRAYVTHAAACLSVAARRSLRVSLRFCTMAARWNSSRAGEPFFAQLALKADAVTIANDEHP
jgi:hypothetical protein